MDVNEGAPRRAGWLERFSPLGGIVFAVWLLVGFFTSNEYDETPQSIVAYAEANETNLIFMLILAIATPILIGWTLARLVLRMRPTEHRAACPHAHRRRCLHRAVRDRDHDLERTAPGREPHGRKRVHDTSCSTTSAGSSWASAASAWAWRSWLCVSIAALRDRWVPAWVAWISLLLGVLAFLSVMGVGLFAYVAWLLVAGLLLLVRGRRDLAVA